MPLCAYFYGLIDTDYDPLQYKLNWFFLIGNYLTFDWRLLLLYSKIECFNFVDAFDFSFRNFRRNTLQLLSCCCCSASVALIIIKEYEGRFSFIRTSEGNSQIIHAISLLLNIIKVPNEIRLHTPFIGFRNRSSALAKDLRLTTQSLDP